MINYLENIHYTKSINKSTVEGDNYNISLSFDNISFSYLAFQHIELTRSYFMPVRFNNEVLQMTLYISNNILYCEFISVTNKIKYVIQNLNELLNNKSLSDNSISNNPISNNSLPKSFLSSYNMFVDVNNVLESTINITFTKL